MRWPRAHTAQRARQEVHGGQRTWQGARRGPASLRRSLRGRRLTAATQPTFFVTNSPIYRGSTPRTARPFCTSSWMGKSKARSPLPRSSSITSIPRTFARGRSRKAGTLSPTDTGISSLWRGALVTAIAGGTGIGDRETSLFRAGNVLAIRRTAATIPGPAASFLPTGKHRSSAASNGQSFGLRLGDTGAHHPGQLATVRTIRKPLRAFAFDTRDRPLNQQRSRSFREFYKRHIDHARRRTHPLRRRSEL